MKLNDDIHAVAPGLRDHEIDLLLEALAFNELIINPGAYLRTMLRGDPGEFCRFAAEAINDRRFGPITGSATSVESLSVETSVRRGRRMQSRLAAIKQGWR